jgi:hypothetical protein
MNLSELLRHFEQRGAMSRPEANLPFDQWSFLPGSGR